MQMFSICCVFYTLDVYEVIYKAQLAAVLLQGGMGIGGNTWALVWSNVPLCCLQDAKQFLSWLFTSTSLEEQELASASPWSPVLQASSHPTLSHPKTQLQLCAVMQCWFWKSERHPGKLQVPSASFSPLGSWLSGREWPCAVTGGMCWDHHTPFVAPRPLPVGLAFSSWGNPAVQWGWKAAQSLNGSSE